MSLTKPDSLSEGNPYAYGSKGALLFQRTFFLVLFLALSGFFIYKLASERKTRIYPEILVLRFADSTPDLNLGVPFQQADLDLIQSTLELKPEQALIASRDAFQDRLRELRTLDRSAAIVYLKGYGCSISKDSAERGRLTEKDPSRTGEPPAPVEPTNAQPRTRPVRSGYGRPFPSVQDLRESSEEPESSIPANDPGFR